MDTTVANGLVTSLTSGALDVNTLLGSYAPILIGVALTILAIRMVPRLFKSFAR